MFLYSPFLTPPAAPHERAPSLHFELAQATQPSRGPQIGAVAARKMRLVTALLHSQRPAVLPRSDVWAALNTWTREERLVGDGFNSAGQVLVRPAAEQAVAGSEGVEEEGAAVAFIVAIIICLEAMGPISLALTVLNAASVIDLGLDLNAPLLSLIHI